MKLSRIFLPLAFFTLVACGTPTTETTSSETVVSSESSISSVVASSSSEAPVVSSESSAEEVSSEAVVESSSSEVASSEAASSSDAAEEVTAAGFCPQGDTCKILPLGDSITDGVGGSGGGYRVELFRLAMQGGYDITFVGGMMNGPNDVDGVAFPQNHEGHSGQTAEWLISNRIPSPALDETPNIILLHIGTNDLHSFAAGPDAAATGLSNLLDVLIAQVPDALIVVAKVIPYPSSAQFVTQYNDSIPGIVEEKANAGGNVIMVDQFEGFDTNQMDSFQIHPNDAGYVVMANKWFQAIESYLN